MVAIESFKRLPSLAARRRNYVSRLKRQMSRFSIATLRSAMLRPANRDDVIECYRAILGREPEHGLAADGHLFGRPRLKEIVAKFSHSGELRAKHLHANLALERARQENYLAKSLIGIQRVQAHYWHYGYLVERLTSPALNELISGQAVVHVHRAGAEEYRVVVTATHERHEEGELQLQLHVDDALVYVMGVTIVPGEALELADRHALLISRVQGVPGAFLEIRRATKAFGDIHPTAVLLAALQGVADALGIAAILGVAATNQIAFGKCPADALVRTYDDFFTAAGAERWAEQFFLFRTDRERKAPAAASRAHVKRAERKRRRKDEITGAAASAARGWLRPPGPAVPVS